jgi:hypothetical protein
MRIAYLASLVRVAISRSTITPPSDDRRPGIEDGL